MGGRNFHSGTPSGVFKIRWAPTCLPACVRNPSNNCGVVEFTFSGGAFAITGSNPGNWSTTTFTISGGIPSISGINLCIIPFVLLSVSGENSPKCSSTLGRLSIKICKSSFGRLINCGSKEGRIFTNSGSIFRNMASTFSDEMFTNCGGDCGSMPITVFSISDDMFAISGSICLSKSGSMSINLSLYVNGFLINSSSNCGNAFIITPCISGGIISNSGNNLGSMSIIVFTSSTEILTNKCIICGSILIIAVCISGETFSIRNSIFGSNLRSMLIIISTPFGGIFTNRCTKFGNKPISAFRSSDGTFAN